MHPPTGHIITITVLAWGHTTAALQLAAKLVRCKLVYVSCLVADPLYEKCAASLDLLFIPGAEDHLRKLVRLIGVEVINPIDFEQFCNDVMPVFTSLFLEKATASRPRSIEQLESIPSPRLAILDVMLYGALRDIHQISENKVSCLALHSAAVASSLKYGHEELGGLGDLRAKFDAIQASTPEEKLQKMNEIVHQYVGSILKYPGLPAAYDYEFYPQKSILPLISVTAVQDVYRFNVECDGIVYGSSDIYEKDAIEANNRAYKFKTAVQVGPLSFPAVDLPEDSSPSGKEVVAFLQKALEEKGEKSVVYTSMGSAFWTAEPEKFWALLDVLIEKEIYFIFANTSPFTVVPEDVKTKLEASKYCFHSLWLPQPQVLRHKAIGWFLTHGGHNSYTEALSAGVPMICFPFEVDQPINAMYIADVHDIGYELLNVRTELGLRPILRRSNTAPSGTIESVREEFAQVLENAYGADGERKRKNVERMRDAIRESWAPGGKCWKELEKLLELVEGK